MVVMFTTEIEINKTLLLTLVPSLYVWPLLLLVRAITVQTNCSPPRSVERERDDNDYARGGVDDADE